MRVNNLWYQWGSMSWNMLRIWFLDKYWCYCSCLRWYYRLIYFWSRDWRWSLLFFCNHRILAFKMWYLWLIKRWKPFLSITLYWIFLNEILSKAKRAGYFIIEKVWAAYYCILNNEMSFIFHLYFFRALFFLKIYERRRFIHFIMNLGIWTILSFACMYWILRSLRNMLSHLDPAQCFWLLRSLPVFLLLRG